MKQKNRSGFSRIGALLLVIVLAVNLVVPSFAAGGVVFDDSKTIDTGILTYDYDKIPAYMLEENYALDALEYIGYDVQALKDNKVLYHQDYIGRHLASNQYLLQEDPILTYIPYRDNGVYGSASTKDENGKTVPDVKALYERKRDKKAGMCCTSFVEYFVFGYLKLIGGKDTRYIENMHAIAQERLANGTRTYPDTWTEMCEGKNGLISQGKVDHYSINLQASKDQTAEYNAIWRQINPGTIIRFGNDSSEYLHYAIYIGTYNNLHYVAHVAGGDRGPEIFIAEHMAYRNDEKTSFPIDFYDFKFTEERYGSIEVIKQSATNNTKLAGAMFTAENQTTKKRYYIGPTNEKGYAITDGLPYDPDNGTLYHVWESKAPNGYAINPTVHKVVLSKDTPLITLNREIVNTEAFGSLQIQKDTNTGKDKAGWQFNVYKNSPSYTTQLTLENSGQMFRVTVSDINGNSVTSSAVTMTTTPLKILKQPQSVKVALGDTARFNVTVQGDGLEYKWYYQNPGGEVNEAGSTAGMYTPYYNYTISNAARSGRAMWCVITDKYGNSVTSDKAYLWVNTDPNAPSTIEAAASLITYGNAETDNAVTVAVDTLAITQQPQDHIDEDGTFATFTVEAQGVGLTYVWETSTDGGRTWTRLTNPVNNTPYTTDAQGIVNISNLQTGDYFVQEIDTGKDGWEYDLTAKPVTVTANHTAAAPAVVRFTNNELTGNLLIEKLTEFDEHLEGWEFAIYADADLSILIADKLYTDEDGYFYYYGLTPGTYWVVEVGHRDPAIDDLYYCANENPQEITIAAGKRNTASFENFLNRGDIEIIKKGNNDKLLSGAVFEATDSKGNVYTFTESAENPGHYYLNDVFFGTFTVTEITPPEGYEIGEQDTWTVTLSKASPNGMATITIINDEILGNLSIKKDTEDGKNLEGWLFNVYADADCSVLLAGNLKTDDKGFITVPGLKPGTVWVREEGHVDTDIADLYYCNSTNPQSAEIKGRETATVTFENKLNRGSIEIIKEDENGNKLTGAEFVAVDADGNTFYFAEDADRPGYYYLNNVPYGTYTITETKYPNGYEAGSETEWVVELGKNSPNGSESITIVNKLKIGTLTVIKVDQFGNPVAGAVFVATAEDGTTYEFPPTDETGSATITVPFGKYTITEKVMPDGYEAGEITEWIAKLDDNTPNRAVTVTAVNNKIVGSITVHKLDENGNLLAGAKFQATHLNTGTVYDFIEVSPGVFELHNLPMGRYQIIETQYPEEYCSPAMQLIMVHLEEEISKRHQTVEVVNIPKQYTIVVLKVDENGNPLANAGFVAVAEDGTRYPFPLTDQYGEARITVPKGTYTITELLFPEGYQAGDVKEWTVTVSEKISMKPYTITAVNKEILGSIEIVKTDEHGNLLSGAGFIAMGKSATYHFVEVEAGRYRVDNIPLGFYLVEEIQWPDGYEGNEGAAFPVELSTKSPNYTESNYTEILEIVNKQKVGKLEIQKITNTGMNKDGWKVNVYRGSVSPENLIPGSPFTTEDGKIVIENLPIGVYIAVEVDDGKELWIYDLEEKVTEVRHNEVGYITIRNTHLGYGQIKKEMPDGGSVAGWIFDVYRVSDNAYIGYFTTDENGGATIGELLPGDYRVVERVPEGSLYLPVGGNEKILTVVAGETKSVTFRNVLQSGEIILNKLDSSDDKALAGAKFLLEWLDGDVWKPVVLSDTIIPGGCRSEGLVNGCLVTDANGLAIFEGLHPDLEYRLTEVEPPEGYMLQAIPVFEGKLPADTLSKEVTAYNSSIYEIPETGDNSYLNVLIPFATIVVCIFLTVVALAAKEGLLTEMIRSNKK